VAAYVISQVCGKPMPAFHGFAFAFFAETEFGVQWLFRCQRASCTGRCSVWVEVACSSRCSHGV